MTIKHYRLTFLFMETILVITNVISTIFMLGVIWVIQLVHYPLFTYVSRNNFYNFHNLHSKNISFVVIFPMLVELISSALLIIFHPDSIPTNYFILGFVLLILIWISTFLLQVKYHGSLSQGFDYTQFKKLVDTNWIRTICWTIRGVIVIYILILLINPKIN